MRDTNLLPCPFCGGEAEVGFGSVTCQQCDARIEMWEASKSEDAIAAWNTRALTPKQKAADEMFEALSKAVGAAGYVVKLVEDTGACGDSPNPMVKADWLGAALHCYAAMAFVNSARAALAKAGQQ